MKAYVRSNGLNSIRVSSGKNGTRFCMYLIKTNSLLGRHVFDNFDISLHKTAPSCSFIIGQSLNLVGRIIRSKITSTTSLTFNSSRNSLCDKFSQWIRKTKVGGVYLFNDWIQFPPVLGMSEARRVLNFSLQMYTQFHRHYNYYSALAYTNSCPLVCLLDEFKSVAPTFKTTTNRPI